LTTLNRAAQTDRFNSLYDLCPTPQGKSRKPPYEATPEKLPLQDRRNPLRFRNMWILELKTGEYQVQELLPDSRQAGNWPLNIRALMDTNPAALVAGFQHAETDRQSGV
jgi:hypothetical protein